jgi:hypothetical protein
MTIQPEIAPIIRTEYDIADRVSLSVSGDKSVCRILLYDKDGLLDADEKITRDEALLLAQTILSTSD